MIGNHRGPLRRSVGVLAAMRIQFGILSAMLALMTACHSGARASDESSGPPGAADNRVRAVRIGFGTACRLGGDTGPASYPVADIGKPGVPKLSARNLAMIHAIQVYVHSKTLMFTVNAPGSLPFIVFDARDGVCSGTQFGALNARACNAFYVPADIHNGIGAMIGCYEAPRPWIPHDGGNKNATPWSKYPN